MDPAPLILTSKSPSVLLPFFVHRSKNFSHRLPGRNSTSLRPARDRGSVLSAKQLRSGRQEQVGSKIMEPLSPDVLASIRRGPPSHNFPPPSLTSQRIQLSRIRACAETIVTRFGNRSFSDQVFQALTQPTPCDNVDLAQVV